MEVSHIGAHSHMPWMGAKTKIRKPNTLVMEPKKKKRKRRNKPWKGRLTWGHYKASQLVGTMLGGENSG